METDWISVLGLVKTVKDIALGMAGGVVAYLFDYSRAKRAKDEEFSFMFSSMFINMTMGAFVAYTVGSMLDSSTIGRDAIIGFSGVSAYNILLLAESKFATWIIEKITGKRE